MAHYVYVLRSDKDGERYIGMTNDIKRRVIQHNAGQVTSTKMRRPLKLEYSEEYCDKLTARNREKYFKTAAGRRFLKKLDFARVVELADTTV